MVLLLLIMSILANQRKFGPFYHVDPHLGQCEGGGVVDSTRNLSSYSLSFMSTTLKFNRLIILVNIYISLSKFFNLITYLIEKI